MSSYGAPRWRGALLAAALALVGSASAVPDAGAWLRGVLKQVAAGQLGEAQRAFDPHFRTPEWRARLAQLRGLSVLRLAPEAGAMRYRLTYRVPQGALSLSATVTLTLTPQRGSPPWRISGWAVVPARRAAQLGASPGPLTPGAALAVRGSGFPPRAAVELRLALPGGEAVLLGRVQASAAGAFALSAQVPQAFVAAPPSATELRLSADGASGPHLSLQRPFRPPSAVSDLNARYQAEGFWLRAPAAYRSLQGGAHLSLIAPGGGLALRADLIPRAEVGAGLTLADYAASFGALHPDLLPEASAVPSPLGADLPGWSVPLQGGRTAALLPDPAGGRWLVLVAEADYAALLLPVARSAHFDPLPPLPSDDAAPTDLVPY